MFSPVKLREASLTKESVVLFQARLKRGRTGRGKSVFAQPLDIGRRMHATPAAFFSFTRFPVVSPVDSRFRGQADGNLNRLWPGRELQGCGPIPV